MRRLIALIGVDCVALLLGSACYGAEPNAVDFNNVYRRASTYLMAGRYDEAVKTIDTVEGMVKANLNREPQRVVKVLMIKARVYTFQTDLKGLGQFLTQFEKEYQGTSVANSVQRAACEETAIYFRLTEDWPQFVRTLEKERNLPDSGDHASSQGAANSLDAMEWDLHMHVGIAIQIAYAYRLMGKTDLPLKEYRAALQYLTANAERFKPLEEQMGGSDSPVSLSKYREAMIPALIRECEAPPDSPLGVLGREVVCEGEQGNYLIAYGYSLRHLVNLALTHYRKAQQVLENHRDYIDRLDAADKSGYVQIQKDLLGRIDDCTQRLAKIDAASSSPHK